MPLAMVLFTVIYPLLRFASGAVAFVILYDVIANRIIPLFNQVSQQIGQMQGQAMSGGGSSGSNFGVYLQFFEVGRLVSVLLAAMGIALGWKLLEMAAKFAASRAAPGV